MVKLLQFISGIFSTIVSFVVQVVNGLISFLSQLMSLFTELPELFQSFLPDWCLTALLAILGFSLIVFIVGRGD